MKKVEEIKKYRAMDQAALEKELEVETRKLAHDSLKVKAGKLANFSLITKEKQAVARIKTILMEKAQ